MKRRLEREKERALASLSAEHKVRFIGLSVLIMPATHLPRNNAAGLCATRLKEEALYAPAPMGNKRDVEKERADEKNEMYTGGYWSRITCK